VALSGLAWYYSSHHAIGKIKKKGLVEIQALFNLPELNGKPMPATPPHN
jgi:hypothetical protein